MSHLFQLPFWDVRETFLFLSYIEKAIGLDNGDC